MPDVIVTIPGATSVSAIIPGDAEITATIPDTALVIATVIAEAAPEPEPPADPWTPAGLATAPLMWLDAADADTLTLSGSDVTEWGNKGSAIATVNQGGGGTAPDYDAAGFNGLPTIDFNGLSDKFWTISANVSTLLGTNDFAVFVVGRADAAAANAESGWLNSGFWGDRGGWVGLPVRSNNTVAAYAYDAGNNNAIAPYTIGDSAIFFSGISGGQNRLRVNGGAEVANASSGLSGGASELITIGRHGSGDAYSFNGVISEFLILRPAPDAETRQRIEGYLAHKWGLVELLPADHPYKASAPEVE